MVFLMFFFFKQKTAYEILHLLGCRAGPHRCDGKHLDREGRVFCASKFQEGKDASSNDRNEQEEGDRLFADREGRQVKKLLRPVTVFVGHILLAHRSSALVSTRTRWPS